ncbi:MAG: molybdopterin-dependent oxidoreductase, partial [Chloroflexi bacterium]|nr:molybdopterin-dependent oxidoreductase [Chloroflexota bacterium]
MGHARKRVEDARFIRGAGHYIEDINLPGQLWLDIVRSPYAHARIKAIDDSAAMKVPGVAAVITGKALETYGLHWMPTIAGDKQMVLPVDTVMYQSQEVAAVIATSRYAAADGVAAVLVDYEPLEVVVDPYKAMDPSSPVLRPDRGEGKQNNHIWHWESGDRAATDAALMGSKTRVKEHLYIPRIHVASIETCGIVADWDSVNGTMTVHMTSQAPHAIRTVLALVAGGAGLPIPEHKIRVITHDIGGGFGGKVPVAEELGIPAADVKVEYGDTDTAPYGLGTYGSRSTPVSGAATAVASRKVRDKARKIAAHLLEAAEDDLEWTNGKFSVKGSPDRAKTIQDIAFAAYTNHPQGMEAGLEAVNYYDPPILTFPFGS